MTHKILKIIILIKIIIPVDTVFSQPYLCSDDNTSLLGLNNPLSTYNNENGFHVCFTSPEVFQAKIIDINLIKSDNSTKSLLSTDHIPKYRDLLSDNYSIIKNLDLSSGTYDGVYKSLEIILDNEFKISAKASYSGSGPIGTKYCHTRHVGLNSFQGSANGIPSKLGDNNTTSVNDNADSGSYEVPGSEGGTSSYNDPGITIFRYDGSPGVFDGISGVDRVYIGSTTNEGAYWSKLEYTLSGDVKKGYMMTLDSNKNYTRNPTKYNTSTNTGSRNSYYVLWKFDFSNDLVIDSSLKSSIEVLYDYTKAIGFAFGWRSSGTNYWNDSPGCHRMVIGPIGISLSLTKHTE